jgi:hypothetical protein
MTIFYVEKIYSKFFFAGEQHRDTTPDTTKNSSGFGPCLSGPSRAVITPQKGRQ